MSCLDDEELLAFVEGRLPRADEERLQAHVDGCDDCLALVADAARVVHGSTHQVDGTSGVSPDAPTVPASSRSSPLARGAMVGRYVVLDLIGRGGMGVVYGAYDPELDRRVALKLVRTDGRDDAGLNQRLVREAQAMARVSHPNVLTVYDAGLYEDQVFVATELIDGGSLAAWLRAAPRSWREILDVFVLAGRGLQAAHAAGLVHRDFKPDNVLVGSDGRVRVADFGLALPTSASEPSAPVTPRPPSGSDSERVTRTGARVGTPAYMAPEHLRGEELDARADLFSFCVALYEALGGARPFSSKSASERLHQIDRGQPERLEAVPRRLRQTLLRGLRARPAERMASMDALLSALERDRNRPRSVVITAGIVISLVAIAAVGWHEQHERSRLCSAAQRFDDAWGAARRAAVEKAFAAAGGATTQESFERVAATLDAYRDRWLGMWTESCEATRKKREQSEELFDLRRACLEQRRDATRSLTDLLLHADAVAVEHAAAAALALDPLEGCASAAALRAPTPLPRDPATRARIAALRRRLDDAAATDRLGRYSDALVAVRPICAEATTLGYKPLEADALLLRGQLEFRDYVDIKVVQATLNDALAAAVSGKSDSTIAAILVNLVQSCNDPQTRPLGHGFARQALAWIDRAGGDDRLRARVLNWDGVTYQDGGHYEEAITLLRQSLALSEKHRDQHGAAVAQSNIGLALDEEGREGEAIQYLERAADGFAASVGPHHPQRAVSLYVLGQVRASVGQLARAEADLREALEIQRGALRPNHNSIAATMASLGDVLWRQEKLDAALVQFRGAMALRLPDDDLVARDAAGAARILAAQGETASALTLLDRALDRPDRGSNHAYALVARGAILRQIGRPRAALADEEAALPELERLGNNGDGQVGECLLESGRAQIALHDGAAARTSLERAVTVLAKAGYPELLGNAQLALAQLLATADRARARALATTAAKILAPLGPRAAPARATAEALVRSLQ